MREFDKILRGLDRVALNSLAEGLLKRMSGGDAENVGQSPGHGSRRDSPLYTRETLIREFTAEENEEAGRPGVRHLREQAEADAARRVVAPYGAETDLWRSEGRAPYVRSVDMAAGVEGIPPVAEAVFPLYKGGEAARRDVGDAVPYEWGGDMAAKNAGQSPSHGIGRDSPLYTRGPLNSGNDGERERMRSVSDFFRRDGRRYDGGFTRY